MIDSYRQYPGIRNIRKVARVVLAVLLGVILLLLFGFLLRPNVEAVSPANVLLAPGNPIVDPPSNSHTALTTTTVSITYDEPISAATVSTRTFAVHAMQTGLLAQTYDVDGGTISLMPDQAFKPGELVQVSATTGTLNLSGQGPVLPTVWQFQTVATRGVGVFNDSGQRLGSSKSWAVALGDLDGNGDLDAFVANSACEPNTVWLNDGRGVFADSAQRLGMSNSHGVALGDLDGDADLDAFIANMSQANLVWLNDGTGSFYDSGQRLGDSSSWAVALGDLDGDADLDAIVANRAEQANTVWFNDGDGEFVDSSQRLGNSVSRAVALGDVDGDNDLDAFVANEGPNEVWLNDGTGSFSDSGQRLGNSVSGGVALGDVNRDGALDAFVANEVYQANLVWLNDGTGSFSDSGQRLGNSVSRAVALGDVDGDNDLDTFVANEGSNAVWWNDGTGSFSDSGQRLGNSESGGVALGDVNHDRALDAFVANAERQANIVWLNKVITPVVEIDDIRPDPSWFLENVVFLGVAVPVSNEQFLREYEWTRIPVSATCGNYPAPTLLGTAARIQDNTTPAGEHRICLRGRINTWSDYDTMTMTVRPDSSAYSDIAVGPQSVSFWADPSAKDDPVHHPSVGDTVNVRVEVSNISVISTPDEVTVFFYDGPITASLHGPIFGTLVGTGTIDFIAARTAEFVTIPWTIGGQVGYRPFAVDIEYTENISHFAHLPLPPDDEPHFESDYKNNRATGAIPVGHITGTYAISVTARVAPIHQSRLYAGYAADVLGKANYAWDVLLATMGATTTIEILGPSGGAATYRETYQTWTDSPYGEYDIPVSLPYEPGIYTAAVVVDDGNLIGSQVISFTVSEPPQPLPDLYIERFSVLLSGPNTYVRTWHDYASDRTYYRSKLLGVQNRPITITARVRNGGSLPVTDNFVVSFYDGTPGDGGTLIVAETVDGLAPGSWENVRYVWTPTQTRTYVIQVAVDETNEITESNELNNYDAYYYRYQACFNDVASRRCRNAAHRDIIDVRAANPDLRAFNLSYVEPVIGDTITMTVEVHNIGHRDVRTTEAFTLTVYDGYPNIDLASTRVLTAPGELGLQRVNGPMNRGSYRTFDVVWDTGYAGTVPGPHDICVEVDTGAEIDEELEENNVNCWDVYVFPDESDLYPNRLTYSNNDPLPNEEIEITAWFENRGAQPFTSTEVVTFYHSSIAPENVITATNPFTITGPIAGHRGISKTHPIRWRTYGSHGTAYIYVEYIKKSGSYNLSPHRHAQRLNIRKNPSPNLRVLSRDIQVDPRSPVSGEDVNVSVDIANVSRSPVATATNFIVEFHTSGPTAGYHELGQLQTIPSLGPGRVTTVQAGETFTMADEFYAVQVSAWPRVQQGDKNYRDNQATTSILQADADRLVFTKTVSIVEGVCGGTDVITVMAGTPVYYCYQMTNRGDVRLGVHDLFDDQLGDVLSGYTYDLLPGETFSRTELVVLKGTPHGTATWTASTDPYAFTATDVAVVNVRTLIYLPRVFKASQN